MRFAPTDEQAQLREVARGMLADDPGLTWERMVAEQGWQAIAIPESAGGFGFGMVELALVAEEIGRALAPLPLLPTCGLAAPALADAPAWLERIAGGETACVASGLAAARVAGGWRVSGTARRVIGGDGAAVVVLDTDAGRFAVDGDRVAVTPLATLDPTRPLADVAVDLELGEADRVGEVGDDPVAGWTLIAAEAVGAAERCLDETVAWLKVRTQFGKPIGTFQALQHKCADMLLQVESARAATWYAAWAIDAGAEDAATAARTARATAGDALFRCAAETVQCHGGIGFTWEHMAHRYLKRARCDLPLLGAPKEHREAVAARLLA